MPECKAKKHTAAPGSLASQHKSCPASAYGGWLEVRHLADVFNQQDGCKEALEALVHHARQGRSQFL